MDRGCAYHDAAGVASFEVLTTLVMDTFLLGISLTSRLLSWHKKSHMGVTQSIQGFIRHIFESHYILFCPPDENEEITLPLVIRIANCTRQQPFRTLASNFKACLRLSCDIQFTTEFSLDSSNMSSDDTQVVLYERVPQSWEEACEIIDARSLASMDESIDAFMESSERVFNDFKARYPAIMGDTTLLDVEAYTALKGLARNRATRFAPMPTVVQLWDAVAELTPQAPATNNPLGLRYLLGSNKFDPIPLGKVYGTDLLWLSPCNGSLDEPDDVGFPFRSTSGYANTQCGAISYSDGHPSEGELTLNVNTADDEEKLRRWVSLGWILQGTSTNRYHTGHVLVIDVEEGRNWNPWIVLASKVPTEGESWDGGDIHVPQSVVRDDPETDEGVLPGDYNRTPVGKIKAMSPNSNDTPIIRLFGPDFGFTVVRRGSSRGYLRSGLGPSLGKIMAWYRDLEKNQEVCYLKDGSEYMRFDLATNKISYSKRAMESFAGEQGLFGEITDDGGVVPIRQRIARLGLGSAGGLETRSKEISSSSGF